MNANPRATFVADPLHIDTRGATARTDYAGWIRDQIWAVLFTAPGERIHRPDFGSGVRQLLFAPGSTELAATVQLLVQGALQQWLGHLIVVEGIAAVTDDSEITVTVTYLIRGTGDRQVDTFSSVGAP